MKGCPICRGKGLIHQRSRRDHHTLYQLVPCWACTPQPIRARAAA